MPTEIDRLEALLRRLAGAPERPDPELTRALTAPFLSKTEQSLLEESLATPGVRSAVDLLLEHRINSALRGAAVRASEGSGRAPPEVPVVRIVRGADGADGAAPRPEADVVQVLTETHVFETVGEKGGELPPIEGETIMLTDARGFEELGSVLHDRPDTSFVDEESEGATSENPLTVVRSMHSLDALAEIVQRALPAYMVEDPPVVVHDLTGEVLSGKYRVKRLLGEGGFGSVYEAVDEMLGASVAIKVLTPKAAHHEEALDRFLDEAKVLTNLDHPNIVRWITFDKTEEGLHYFVMEHLTGEELSELLHREGRLPPERVLPMLLEMLSALRAAHHLPDGSALYHLDLKPQNVFVVKGDPERVKVIDFGISQHVGAEARAAAGIQVLTVENVRAADLGQTIASQMATLAPAVTMDGEPVRRARGGTLLYASPEQCLHLAGDPQIVELDGRSDLYSLGVMAFQILTGELPYGAAATPQEAIEQHLSAAPAKLASHGVRGPRGLSTFVERCLAKHRDDRFADSDEAYAFLERVANPPARWPKVAAALAVVAALVLWVIWPDPGPEPFIVVGDSSVYFFGPENREQSLEVDALVDRDPDQAVVRLVDDPVKGNPLLADWTAALEEGRVRLRAPPGLASFEEEKVYLEISGDGRPQFSSRVVNVVFLADDAWLLRSAGIPGLPQGGVLDSVGATLEVHVVARSEYIGGVFIAHAGLELRATRDTSRSNDGAKQIFKLPLDDFDLGKQAALDVRVVDRAGGEKRETIELKIDAAALSVSASLSGCIERDTDRYLVNPRSEPVLTIQSNRGARSAFEVLDAAGAPIDVSSEDLSGGAHRLHFPPSESAYAGTIRVSVDDTEQVMHTDVRRGKATRILRFDYETQLPDLTVTVAGRETTHRVGELEAWYTRDPHLRVTLARNDVQVTVDVVCTGGSPGAPMEVRKELHQPRSEVAEFQLPADGTYLVEVRGYRYSGAGTELPVQAEFQHEVLVVLDRSAPTIQLNGTAGLVLASGSESDWRAELVVTDGQAMGATNGAARGTQGTPIALTWELLEGGRAVRNGNLAPLDPDGTKIVLDWESLGIEPTSLTDGTYELRLAGTDAAGNRLAPAGYAWEVARSGPSISFLQPSGAEWLSSGGSRFDVVVTARDPNGVASISSTVRPSGGGEPRGTVELTATGGNPASGEWKASFLLPSAWSNSRIRVECKAVDARGVTTLASREVDVGAFELALPQLIDVRVVRDETLASARMRYVAGNDRYLFGGQSDRLENIVFRNHGLGSFDDKNREKSWGRETPIDAFYLDEAEVSVAEFRTFLRSGYMDPTWWENGAAPGGARHGELSRRLDEEPEPNIPVTGVDWNEASAYARWAGKRLPSFEEWEYAVRGGSEYRPFSCAVAGAPLPDPAEFNVDIELAGRQATWPADRGVDTTPTGIRNLCSNVSEWTTSVGNDGASRFAVGANYASMNFDFSQAVPRPPSSHAPMIGFRCALAFQDVLDALEGRQGTIRVRDLAAEKRPR